MFSSLVTICQVLSGPGGLAIVSSTSCPKDLLYTSETKGNLGSVTIALEELALSTAQRNMDHASNRRSSLLAVPIELEFD